MYILDSRTIIGNVSYVQKQYVNKIRMWHMRLGHISEQGLYELGKKNLMCGYKVESPGFCERCAYEKAKRIKFDTGIHQTKEF